ncbi:MAG: hypothetical protein AB7I27_07510 [Bacteriovoracaceae bacterium]
MRTIIIISKCTKVDHEAFEFHFKGVYAGESIKRILLTGGVGVSIERDHEYLLYVQISQTENEILKGRIIKSKLLDECRDKS